MLRAGAVQGRVHTRPLITGHTSQSRQSEAEDAGREEAQQKEASYEKPAPHIMLRVPNLGSFSV